MKKHFVTLLSVMIITSALKMTKRKNNLLLTVIRMNELEILINQWRKKGVGTPPSESRLSHGSDKSERSCVSNRSSVKEKRRVAVEAKLEVQTLKEKQELERKLEEVEGSKAELNRKLELLSAKTKMEQAEIDLLLERGEENEAKDGMNDY